MIDRASVQPLATQIAVWGCVAVLGASALGALLGGLAFGLGLAGGGAVALLSFWWLGLTHHPFASPSRKRWVRFAAITLLRYLAVVVLLVALVRTPWVSLSALALGVALPLPVIVWKGIQAARAFTGKHAG